MVKPAQSRPPAPRHARMRTPLPSAWCSGLAVVTALIVPAHAEARSDAKPSPPQAEACTLEPGPVRTVTRIIDAETIGLDDASEVRLAGAMPPRARDSGAQAGAWPLETTALSALADLVLGKSVELAYGEQKSDRYGRRRAHVFVRTPSQARVWVQGELLTRGLARAYALPSDGACLAELVAHERVARDAKAGLWAVGLYRPKRADRTALLMSLRSSFQIATGKVVAVSRTKSAVYLNFGADWRSDFSVRIAKSIIDENPDWEEGLESLKDK
ncbi:MAG: thermonuclease family protein, partial [Hyphomicrobium sp.]